MKKRPRRYKERLTYWVANIAFIGFLAGCGNANKVDGTVGVNGTCSPDGKLLAFQRSVGSDTHLGVMEIKSGKISWVESGKGHAVFPSWTKDGKLVYSFGNEEHTAYQTFHGGLGEGFGIRVWDGGKVKKLPSGQWRDYGASVAPDGHTYWCATSRGREYTECDAVSDIGSRMMRGNLDNPDEWKIVYAPKGRTAGISQPVVSPDAERLAWAEFTDLSDPWRIFLSPASELKKAKQLTPNTMNAYAPNWSPDGRFLTFTACGTNDVGWCVYLMEVETGAMKRLCPGENSAFSADGKSIVFDDGERLHTHKIVSGDWPRAVGGTKLRGQMTHRKILLLKNPKPGKVTLPKECAFDDATAFYIRVKFDWDGDIKRLQFFAVGDYGERENAFQLYLGTNGKPTFGMYDVIGSRHLWVASSAMTKKGVHEITAWRIGNSQAIAVDAEKPVWKGSPDGFPALLTPQCLNVGSGCGTTTKILELEIGTLDDVEVAR